MQDSEVRNLGEELYRALRDRTTVSPLTDRYPGITINDAYRISLYLLDRRKEDGESVVGKKIGVTSPAVQDMLNVRQPDFGFLTNAMQCANEVSLDDMIAPRAEGEIAFVLGKDLAGPGVTEVDVLDATDFIVPCFEIVDSRIKDWKIRIQDTVADNASCGKFALNESAKVNPRQIDLAAVEATVYKNDKLLSQGSGKDAMGNPLTCVAWLANTLGEYGINLDKGDIILSGSLVPLESVQPGDRMALELTGIGNLAIEFK